MANEKQTMFVPSSAMSIKSGSELFSDYPASIQDILDKIAESDHEDMGLLKELHEKWLTESDEMNSMKECNIDTPKFVIYGMFFLSPNYLTVVTEVRGATGPFTKWKSGHARFPNIMLDSDFQLLCQYMEDPSKDVFPCCARHNLSMTGTFSFLPALRSYGVNCKCCDKPVVDSGSLLRHEEVGEVVDKTTKLDSENAAILLEQGSGDMVDFPNVNLRKEYSYADLAKIIEKMKKGESVSTLISKYALGRYRFVPFQRQHKGEVFKGISVLEYMHESCRIEALGISLSNRLFAAFIKRDIVHHLKTRVFVKNEYGSESYKGRWIQFESSYGDLTIGWRKHVLEIQYPQVEGKSYKPETKQTHDFGYEHVNGYDEAAEAVEKFLDFARKVTNEAHAKLNFRHF